jgi:hypothetical protein
VGESVTRVTEAVHVRKTIRDFEACKSLEIIRDVEVGSLSRDNGE